MKILKIIHGYPPAYNAGSEVYSQMLCHGLAKNHEVCVITREENPFKEDFSLTVTQDSHEPSVTLYKINIPSDKYRYRYQHPQVDQQADILLDRVKPDLVHIGHLNHLSVSLVEVIAKKNIPVVYTLHDYWLMCPRGQFIQRNSPASSPLWSLCDGQEDKKCAQYCYSGYFSGNHTDNSIDTAYWAGWIKRRMDHVHKMVQNVKCFIAPSLYLYNRYVKDFGLPRQKMVYLDYGFDLKRLTGRQRIAKEIFTFGYIGTHIPAKGIQLLIQAFSRLGKNCQLRIWGRSRQQNTEGLYALISQLPPEIQSRIEWRPEYTNEEIISAVFNHVDCIVVPSIWVENSPLVIHEALQVRIPVITANIGGMAEYVHHEVNGLLFEHRNEESLSEQMQRLVNDPSWVRELGQRGYIQSHDGNIPDRETHITEIEKIYNSLL